MDASEFKIRMKRANLTRAEAAERLGVKVDTVNAYCKAGTSARPIPPELVRKVEEWVQHVPEKLVQAGKLVQVDVPIEKSEPKLVQPSGTDFETGYIEITEDYARSLGYGRDYSESDWFERAKAAILSSRRLGETRGKIVGHERWVGAPIGNLIAGNGPIGGGTRFGVSVDSAEWDGSQLVVHFTLDEEPGQESFRGKGKKPLDDLVSKVHEWSMQMGVTVDAPSLVRNALKEHGE